MKELLRELPPVHQLQNDDRFNLYMKEYHVSRDFLTNLVQQAIDDVREMILENRWSGDGGKERLTDEIFRLTEEKVADFNDYQLRRVVNATGTIIHTNLGRSRLSKEAIKQVVEAAANYSNLEYQLDEGKRGSRHSIIEDWLKMATGAEAAMVVNNNAAAVYLILRALAFEKEVIVSRGQLVEIGGSFRISAIMEESGADLVEVGTTNKTHLFDYENAITENTAMIMKVHTSNFKTIGFTKSVETDELISLRDKQDDILFYEDLGSGALYDFSKHGIGEEPVVGKVLEMGADLVSFSGDKLLGGPQAGIIAGKKEIIERLKKHQLARVLRVDKMTLAALEATLKAYVLGSDHLKEIPTVRDALLSVDEVRDKANSFLELFRPEEYGYGLELVEATSQIGGGTMPDVPLPTIVATITHDSFSSQDMLNRLRKGSPSIVARAKDEKVIIDFRTLADDELSIVAAGLKRITAED